MKHDEAAAIFFYCSFSLCMMYFIYASGLMFDMGYMKALDTERKKREKFGTVLKFRKRDNEPHT